MNTATPPTLDLRIPKALQLLDKGLTPTKVAAQFGISRQTVSEWREKYQRENQSFICKRCAEQTNRPVQRGLCPFCIGELREGAVKALVAHRGASDFELAQRTKAISALRDLGYTQQEALQVRARAVDGHSAEEIVEWLCGEEREAVAV